MFVISCPTDLVSSRCWEILFVNNTAVAVLGFGFRNTSYGDNLVFRA